jgi:hypothetical protein
MEYFVMGISRFKPERFKPEEVYSKRTSNGLSMFLLSVIAALVAIADLAIFFWPDNVDPEVRAALRYVGAAQQQTTSGVEAISNSLAAEQRSLKVLSDKLFVLTTGLSKLQGDATQILQKNTELVERLDATQTQMAEDNALSAGQLKALTQMVRDNASAAEQLKVNQDQMVGAIAKISEDTVRPAVLLPMARPLAASKRRTPAPAQQAKIQPH